MKKKFPWRVVVVIIISFLVLTGIALSITGNAVVSNIKGGM